MSQQAAEKTDTSEVSYVEFSPSECKGCQLCADACPKKCIVMSEALNERSYHPAAYTGEGCTGCGICFYACPEPGAIKVYRKKKDQESGESK
ncbi:MAG: 4Fe-4S dicluster domain-containing protein [Candidatus Eisenbacteria bacterium]